MTLETLHSYRTELDAAGNIKPDSKKFHGIGQSFLQTIGPVLTHAGFAVDALLEYSSLCIDWTRLSLPLPSGEDAGNQEGESDQQIRKRCVRDAIALVVEGAVRSGLAKSAKVLKKDVDLSRAGIAMWRMP